MSEVQYRQAFAVVGYELGPPDAVSDARIADVEGRLGCKVPLPLREFYRVAGNARRVIDHHDHFLLPEDWSLEGGKLVFLTENQAVVLYAVDAAAAHEDPPVVMSNNAEPHEWHEVCGSCSEFLRVMVHWEGSFGGAMPIAASGLVDESLRTSLEARLDLVGEVNAMWAYGKPGLAVCLVQWDDGWRVFVGAEHEDSLAEVDALGVELEVYE